MDDWLIFLVFGMACAGVAGSIVDVADDNTTVKMCATKGAIILRGATIKCEVLKESK